MIFDDGGVIASGGWAIKPEHWHGHIDPRTVAWWMNQSDAAQAFSFTGELNASTVALKFAEFIQPYDVSKVWAKDPDFDLVLLKAWWERIQKHEGFTPPRWPFKYYMGRSCRTVFELAKEYNGVDPQTSTGMYVAHNPVDDAAQQARAVIEARRVLRPKGFSI